MNKIVNFLGKPRTIENVIKNRKISWLELFYDLWLIWGWGEFSDYFDNHGNDSIINILIINIDMILIGLASIFIPEAVNGNFHHITWLYIILELFMGAVWIGLGIFDKTHGPAARVWGITCYSCNHCLRPLF
jgi:low temperature requirement protein LtrA